MSVPFINLWTKDATDEQKHQFFALNSGKDFAIVGIPHKYNLWISLCILSFHMNNPAISPAIKINLILFISEIRKDREVIFSIDDYLLYVDIRYLCQTNLDNYSASALH